MEKSIIVGLACGLWLATAVFVYGAIAMMASDYVDALCSGLFAAIMAVLAIRSTKLMKEEIEE